MSQPRLFSFLTITLMLAGFSSAVQAQSPDLSLTGNSYVHRFERDVDSQARMSVNSFRLGGQIDWTIDRGRTVGLSLGYTRLDYAFSGSGAFANDPFADDPWNLVEIYELSLPVRWAIDSSWSAIAVPSVSLSVEEGVASSAGLTGGGLFALAYRFNPQLTIGGGLGAFTELEDSATVFPFVTVRWQPTETLIFNIGRSDNVSSGPGLGIVYQPSEQWHWFAGGSYQSHRFRLDGDGVAPDGVAEDSSLRAYAGVRYALNEQVHIRLVGGLDFGGELELEDDGGHRVVQEDYDTAPFVGASFGIRF